MNNRLREAGMITALAAAMTGVLCTSCAGKQEGKSEKEVLDPEFTAGIQVVKAQLSNRERELTLTGKVGYGSKKRFVPSNSHLQSKNWRKLAHCPMYR